MTMKQVIIVVPKGDVNLSSITGSFEILTRANEFFRMMGNPSRLEVRIAGFVPKLKLDAGFFSVHPVSIKDIKKTDLVIIPSVSYDPRLIKENEDLITWMAEQYKRGAEIGSMCSGLFLLAATGLLDGKNCCTHWNMETDFKRLFPNV